MRAPIFLLFCSLFLFGQGCASNPPVLEAARADGSPVYLSDESTITRAIEKFYAKRDLTTEEGKIDYLLDRVRNSNLTFIRNQVKFNGDSAAKFLSWKLGRVEGKRHARIPSARAFISEIASASKVSGKLYLVKSSDGSLHYLHHILKNELDFLESYLKEHYPAPEPAASLPVSDSKAQTASPTTL